MYMLHLFTGLHSRDGGQKSVHLAVVGLVYILHSHTNYCQVSFRIVGYDISYDTDELLHFKHIPVLIVEV